MTDFGFTGQRREGFGLLDYRARFYAPGLGRFISADTVVADPGNPQDLNRYSYVRNSPLLYADPSGHCVWDVCLVEGTATLVVLFTALLIQGSFDYQINRELAGQVTPPFPVGRPAEGQIETFPMAEPLAEGRVESYPVDEQPGSLLPGSNLDGGLDPRGGMGIPFPLEDPETILNPPASPPAELELPPVFTMAIGRKQALNRMEGLSAQVEQHLRKIADEPGSHAAGHWRGEVNTWLNEIERLSAHVGEKTRAEWLQRIENWRGQLGGSGIEN